MFDAEAGTVQPEETPEKDKGTPINVLLYKAGKHWRTLQFVDGKPRFGGEGHSTGRKSDTITPEQQEKNRKKRRKRNKRDVIDTVNANEGIWTMFNTYSYDEEIRDPDVILADLDVFHKYVARKVRERFDPAFVLNYAGVYGFQDGKRCRGKQGRFVLHGHEAANLPFWPVRVICCEDRNPVPGKGKGQMYFQNDGTFSKVATRDTFFFDGAGGMEEDTAAKAAAERYRKEHLDELRTLAGTGKRIFVKRLPFYTLAWGKGHTFCRAFGNAFKNVRKYAVEKEKEADFGAYMAGNYMVDNDAREQLEPEELEKFDGKKGWFHSQFETTKDGTVKRPGGLKRVEKLYNQDARQELIDAGAWDCLTKVSAFCITKEKDADPDAFEIGWIVENRFNLHCKQYPNIKRISLNWRGALQLDEELDGVCLEIDREIERRELEKQREALAGEPPPVQDDAWWQGDFWEYSNAYQQQCVF